MWITLEMEGHYWFKHSKRRRAPLNKDISALFQFASNEMNEMLPLTDLALIKLLFYGFFILLVSGGSACENFLTRTSYVVKPAVDVPIKQHRMPQLLTTRNDENEPNRFPHQHFKSFNQTRAVTEPEKKANLFNYRLSSERWTNLKQIRYTILSCSHRPPLQMRPTGPVDV